MDEDTIITVFAIIGIVAGVIVLAAAMGLLLAFPVKWTWNATMPYLFNLPAITWGKAWCLYFLAHCLGREISCVEFAI